MVEPFKFTAETNIMEALDRKPESDQKKVIKALQGLGLKCVMNDEMCVAAAVETLSDASRYHDVDLASILEGAAYWSG